MGKTVSEEANPHPGTKSSSKFSPSPRATSSVREPRLERSNTLPRTLLYRMGQSRVKV
jgi:hypothetical protein